MQTDGIGTKHTIELCNGRSIVVQASRLGDVLIQIEDRNGAAATIDTMSLDPATAGAVVFAIEQAGEALQAQRARAGRMALELARAGA